MFLFNINIHAIQPLAICSNYVIILIAIKVRLILGLQNIGCWINDNFTTRDDLS